MKLSIEQNYKSQLQIAVNKNRRQAVFKSNTAFSLYGTDLKAVTKG